MKLIIDIPEVFYEALRETDEIISGQRSGKTLMSVIYNAVANGIPLPKGHGRLIDADELYGDFIDGTEGYNCQTWNRIEIGDVIEYAPTIIEADKESEDKE